MQLPLDFQASPTATSELIASPLNYTGGKFKLLPQILPHFPKRVDVFVDLFCGGANVGINADSEKTVLNDCDENVVRLLALLKHSPNSFVDAVNKIIDDYSLSQSAKYGYARYGCESNSGLALYNKNPFLRLRKDFNDFDKTQLSGFYRSAMFYVLVVFSFNNQIRFNAKGEFNLPVGKRDFNVRMQNKLQKFINRLQSKNCEFSNVDFRKFDISQLSDESFVYVDPPYLISCAAYNERNGWTENDERDLLVFLDELNARKIKFALSNVLKSKGRKNKLLETWLFDNRAKYKAYDLDYDYKNSNYQKKDRCLEDEEILVVNYGN